MITSNDGPAPAPELETGADTIETVIGSDYTYPGYVLLPTVSNIEALEMELINHFMQRGRVLIIYPTDKIATKSRAILMRSLLRQVGCLDARDMGAFRVTTCSRGVLTPPMLERYLTASNVGLTAVLFDEIDRMYGSTNIEHALRTFREYFKGTLLCGLVAGREAPASFVFHYQFPTCFYSKPLTS
jgi:hypothetical protein